jgi:hypothetical protein
LVDDAKSDDAATSKAAQTSLDNMQAITEREDHNAISEL